MKYYRVTAYTCYCGEQTDEYIAIPDNESYESDKWLAVIDDIIDTNAFEWWDDQSREEYDDDYDAYRAECGCDITEVTKEEYEKYTKGWYRGS